MSRSIFGWSYPPGVSVRSIDEAYGIVGPCECCGTYEDDCICPECPECGDYGNPACYKDESLTYTMKQLHGQAIQEGYLRKKRAVENARYDQMAEERQDIIEKEQW